MKKPMRLLVIGATGDVGRGIVAVAAARGWSIAAAGRTQSKLDELKADHPPIVAIVGDVASPEAAAALMKRAADELGGIDAVVVSVNAPARMRPLFDNDEDGLVDLFRANVISHFHAAQAALDALPAEGVLLGIGGGMADWVPPNGAHLSIMQAGLRNLYRGLAREHPDRTIRQMQIASMVNGMNKRAIAQESWVTDLDCGEHVCAIFENPAAFNGPIIVLKDRASVGRPADRIDKD